MGDLARQAKHKALGLCTMSRCKALLRCTGVKVGQACFYSASMHSQVLPHRSLITANINALSNSIPTKI